jgi:hypothetical protein
VAVDLRRRSPPIEGQLRFFRQSVHPPILLLTLYDVDLNLSYSRRKEKHVRYLMSGEVLSSPQDFIENYTNPAQEST